MSCHERPQRQWIIFDKVNNFSEVQRFDDKTFTNEVSDDLTALKDILNRLSDKGLIDSDDLANLEESLDETETKQNQEEEKKVSNEEKVDDNLKSEEPKEK